MIHGRKFVLVSPEEAEMSRTQPQQQAREPQQAEPLEPVDSIATLDNEMQRILGLPIKSDFEKWSLYKQVLQKFVNKLRDLRDKDKIESHESAVADTDQQAKDEEIPRTPANTTYNKIVAESFGTESAKSKATVLLNILKRAENVTWDGTGKLSVAGTILDSNLHDLLHSAIRPRKSRPPGWEEFEKLLLKLNVPDVYLKRRKAGPTKAHSRDGSLNKWRPY